MKIIDDAGNENGQKRQESTFGLLKLLGTESVEWAAAQVEWLQREAEKGRSMQRLLDTIGAADAAAAVREVERLKMRDRALALLLEGSG